MVLPARSGSAAGSSDGTGGAGFCERRGRPLGRLTDPSNFVIDFRISFFPLWTGEVLGSWAAWGGGLRGSKLGLSTSK